MPNRGLLAFLLLFLAWTCRSQNVMGYVMDKTTNLPLPGAIVSLGGNTAITSESGEFTLTVQGKARKLKVHYTGYEDAVIEISTDLNIETGLIIKLDESNTLLNVAEVSSSRYERRIAESSVSVDVIQPRMAERLNSVVASQVIDRAPGVQIIDGQANIRGGSGYSYGAGSRVMLIMDDLQILQPDAGFTNWSDLPMENIGQIEVVKGAASALYGSAAMNGVIHFRTIKPSIEPYTAVTLSTRIFGHPSNGMEWWGSDHGNHAIPSDNAIIFTHRQKVRSYDLVLGGMYRNELSYNRSSGSENYRVSGTLVKHFSDRLIGSLGVNFNTGSSSSFFYWSGAGALTGDTTSYSHSNRTRFNIDPSLQYFSTRNYRHRVMARWLHIDNENLGNQSNHSDNIFSEYQVQKEFEKYGLMLTLGALYNGQTVKAPLYNDTVFHNTNLAAYVQADEKITPRLTLSVGMRYEYYSLKGPDVIDNTRVQNPVSDSKPVFRFGLNYQLARASFLRMSYGEGFRFPTLAEKYIRTNAGGFNIIPNLRLGSEYGRSAEVGFKQGYKFGPVEGLLDVAAFWSRYYDMIEFTLVVTPAFQFFYQAQNIGDTEIRGLEFSTQGKIVHGKNQWIYQAGLTLMDPKFQEWDTLGKQIPINRLNEATKGQQNASASSSYENILKYRSKELVRVDLEYQRGPFYAGVNFSYASHVRAIDKLFELELFIKGVQAFRQEHDHGYRLYDARFGYKLKHFDFQVNVQNLTNEIYTLRPALMEAPRSFGGRITYTL